MNQAECCIKGEESNMEKQSRDAKERPTSRQEGPRPRKEHHKYSAHDTPIARLNRRPYDNTPKVYMSLNTKREDILREVSHLDLLPIPSRQGWSVRQWEKMKAHGALTIE